MTGGSYVKAVAQNADMIWTWSFYPYSWYRKDVTSIWTSHKKITITKIKREHKHCLQYQSIPLGATKS